MVDPIQPTTNQAAGTSQPATPLGQPSQADQVAFEVVATAPGLTPDQETQVNELDYETLATDLKNMVGGKDDGPNDNEYNDFWTEKVSPEGLDPEVGAARGTRLAQEMARQEPNPEFWLDAYHGRKFTSPINNFAQNAIQGELSEFVSMNDVVNTVYNLASRFKDGELNLMQEKWFDPLSAEQKNAFYNKMAESYTPEDWLGLKGTRNTTDLAQTMAQELTPRAYEDDGPSLSTVAHDAFRPIEMGPPPAGASQNDIDNWNLIQKYNPAWNYNSGVRPRPAVNENGNVSGGLQDTGAPSDDASNAAYYGGQVYARVIDFADNPNISNLTDANGTFNPALTAAEEADGDAGTNNIPTDSVGKAIMYTQYWPKDHTTGTASTAGHRHDWESVVLFLDKQDKPLMAAYSAHGGYPKAVEPAQADYWAGDAPKAAYDSSDPAPPGGTVNLTHSAYPTTQSDGIQEKAVDVNRMPSLAKQALEQNDWKNANYPMSSDDTFYRNIAKAWHHYDKVTSAEKFGDAAGGTTAKIVDDVLSGNWF